MLAHLFEPTQSTHTTTQPAAATATPTPQASTAATDTDDSHHRDTVNVRGHQRRRVPSEVGRRVPSSDAALAKWRAIWNATKHLDTATADDAATHGVSLRTLQFIRAAGAAGHLDQPIPTPNPDIATGLPPLTGNDSAQPNHHGVLTNALT
jgi:hypothetical protein